MAETSPKDIKILYRQTDDPRIEVLYMPCADRTETFSFRASSIDHLESLGDDRSLIVLKSGKCFTLPLPHAELAEKIDAGYSPVDLKNISQPVWRIGDREENGDVYAGISPSTKSHIYVAAPSPKMDFNEAAKHARDLSMKTGKNYRVPTADELDLLFNNSALIGGFEEDWYRSSTLDTESSVRDQYFKDGRKTTISHDRKINVRFIRD